VMKKETISFNLNGEEIEVYTDPAGSLLSLLRDQLGLTGTKVGCGQGECGACTVLMDGQAVNSCLIPAGKVAGSEIVTIEALSADGKPDFVQEAFVEKGAVQCGFCTPGMVMSTHALLKQNSRPSPEDVKKAISGNLCRCTGYKQIEEAILHAADKPGS
jgi:aerobic carbon-monoxide dehydrogenase small subunit